MAKESGDKPTGANEPAHNSGERAAASQSFSEEVQTGKSAIPSEKPDWAKDLPDPKGGKSK